MELVSKIIELYESKIHTSANSKKKDPKLGSAPKSTNSHATYLNNPKLYYYSCFTTCYLEHLSNDLVLEPKVRTAYNLSMECIVVVANEDYMV